MNEIIVPIDITQEEKEILAVFSKRQFFLVFPPGVAAAAFLLWGNIPFLDGFIDFALRFLVMIGIVGVSLCLAYIKLDKYEMYLSQYMITQFKFKRGQKTYF